MCTVPDRKESLLLILNGMLHGQSLPVDSIHLWLNGYKGVAEGMPNDRRVTYHSRPDNPGPWIRYSVLDQTTDQDIFVTLDDDIKYPPDYIDRGVTEVIKAGMSAVITYGGFRWDCLNDGHDYADARQHFAFDDGLSNRQVLSLLMGGVSFFPSRILKEIPEKRLNRFPTNDDMAVSLYLKERGVRILCCPRRANWIQPLETSDSPNALFRRDLENRHRTFQKMVRHLNFDPTAGQLAEYLKRDPRILVVADRCPPLQGTQPLDDHLRSLHSYQNSVHLLAPVPSSLVRDVQRYVDIPYTIHVVSVPEPGGPLDWFKPVRTWRDRRVQRSGLSLFSERVALSIERLRPGSVFFSGQSVPTWLKNLAPHATALHLD